MVDLQVLTEQTTLSHRVVLVQVAVTMEARLLVLAAFRIKETQVELLPLNLRAEMLEVEEEQGEQEELLPLVRVFQTRSREQQSHMQLAVLVRVAVLVARQILVRVLLVARLLPVAVRVVLAL